MPVGQRTSVVGTHFPLNHDCLKGNHTNLEGALIAGGCLFHFLQCESNFPTFTGSATEDAAAAGSATASTALAMSFSTFSNSCLTEMLGGLAHIEASYVSVSDMQSTTPSLDDFHQ